jgi:hypothetical protein
MGRKRFTLIQPSTRSLIKEGRRTPGYRLFDFPLFYARWPYLYISIGSESTRSHPDFQAAQVWRRPS